MIECYPPIPVYIVTGIILAMFTTVTSKVESGNRYKADARFALFLIVMLTIPYATLLADLVMTWRGYSPHCQENCCNRWATLAHAITIFPLILGATIWFWTCSGLSIRRFRFVGT